MPIVCFEGPSAVGKTTMAQQLAHTLGAIVIPEVNMLFSRPADPPPTWYFERQVERWQQAMTAVRSTDLVILDGDPFQPFWYNWAYHYVGWERWIPWLPFMSHRYGWGLSVSLTVISSLRQVSKIYVNGEPQIPHGNAVVLSIIWALFSHNKPILLRCRCWQPERVTIIASTNGEATLGRITAALEYVPPPLTHITAVNLFHTLIEWLRAHEPNE